jgi:hypothetical protein
MPHPSLGLGRGFFDGTSIFLFDMTRSDLVEALAARFEQLTHALRFVALEVSPSIAARLA